MSDKKLKIFDFLNSVTFQKKDLSNHPDFAKEYNPYMINMWLSMSANTVFESLFASRYPLTKKAHYDFLFNVLEKKRTFFSYAKKEKDEDIKLISEYYGISEEESIEIVNILEPEEIQTIRNLFK